MTFDHLGGPIKNITFQPLGFVSAAAGFIYLSGFVYGLVYTRTSLNCGFNALKTKSIRRAIIIYFYHLLVLLIVIIPMLLNLIHLKELTMFTEHPGRSFIMFNIFLLQPQNMDILPMYVLFILAGPFVIKALLANKEKIVLLISGSLWFICQWEMFQYNNLDLNQYGIHLGHFNFFCWQFLFFIGVYFGYVRATGKPTVPVTSKLVALTLLVFLVLIVVRYLPHDNLLHWFFALYADRSTLGITRLINFGVIAYLIYVLTLKREKLFQNQWLSFLGRHSLQVFAYSVFVIFFVMPFKPIIKSYSAWAETIFDLVAVISLSIPAWLHQTSMQCLPFVKKVGL
jgi:hypothetical protein